MPNMLSLLSVCWRWPFFCENTNDKWPGQYFPAVFAVIESFVGFGIFQLVNFTYAVGSCLVSSSEI
jgi:hypothetical protein